MYFSASFILAALPFLVAAAPAPQSSSSSSTTGTAYLLKCIDSNNDGDGINGATIVALDSGFVVNGANETTPVTVSGNTVALDVQVPQGQAVYLTSTSQLSYTPPHNPSIPSGGQASVFGTSSDPSTSSSAKLQYTFAGATNSQDWLACPYIPDGQVEQSSLATYQIWASTTSGGFSGTNKNHCIDIAIGFQKVATVMGSA